MFQLESHVLIRTWFFFDKNGKYYGKCIQKGSPSLYIKPKLVPFFIMELKNSRLCVILEIHLVHAYTKLGSIMSQNNK